jgi:hypothetical protein
MSISDLATTDESPINEYNKSLIRILRYIDSCMKIKLESNVSETVSASIIKDKFDR